MAHAVPTSWSISATSRRPHGRHASVIRCGGSPFGEVSGKSSASPFGGKPSSSSPFGGAGGGSPFGTGTSSVDPFAAAPAGTDRKEKGAWGENSKRSKHGRVVEKADYRAWNDVEVFDVPSDLRRPDAEVVAEHVKFYGLEELFPGTGLQEKFNSDAAFRTAIRRAIRNDLFVPDPNTSDKVNAAISSLSSSLMVNWKTSRTGYASLSRVFADDGVENLTGEKFIQTLGALCGPVSHGSLIDITSTGRRQERHSWHQDSGLDRFTVMVGFPPESNWTGVGVFSHSCKLSHPLRRAQDGEEGEVIQWEDYEVGELPVSAIGRPEYSPGHEVMVYCDATHLHSAPDETNRESVWRFM